MASFQIPAYSQPLSIAQARADLPPEQFRQRLRDHLKANPGLTLAQVAHQLKVSRQYVSQLVGKLNRPNAASPLFFRMAPKTEQARQKLPEMRARVARGDSAEQAAAKLGISVNRAYYLGFRSKTIRKQHGSRSNCACWRCRKAHGLVIPRMRINEKFRAEIMDLLVWSDPFTAEELTQSEVARLLGTNQSAVSRVARGVSQ
jgi:predicted XRE-type DNA-binding protein